MTGKLSDMTGSAVRGFLMGSADVVPGVSGGTVALVTGIYPRLVAAISTGSRALAMLAKGKLRDALTELRRVEWWFLVPLVIGAILAVLTLARLIEDLLHEQPIRTAAVFMGLILGTIVVAWRILHRPEARHLAIAGAVGVAAFLLFGLQSGAATDPSLLVFFLSGALAICAFILPGVSGSFILLSIGMYQAVLGAVNDRDMAAILVFAAGATVSLAVFSRLLERLLNDHHDAVVAALIGLMLGSLRILWPWPNGLGDEDGVGATELAAPSGDVLVPILLVVAAAALVIVVSTAAERRARAVSTAPAA
jgi:putative membrane protein